MNLKVGDPVIVYTPVWLNNKSKKGYIKNIFDLGCNKIIYFVCLSSDIISIFPYNGDIIELDIEESRDLKLKDLGI